MFVNKILSGKVDISDEAYEHYKTIDEAGKALAKTSGMSWNFTQSDIFDKALRVSKVEGFVFGAVAVAAIVGVTNFVKKRKNKAEK